MHPSFPKLQFMLLPLRYMDSFEMHSGRELWLVFRDEGKSLRDWMYDRYSTA